LIRRIAVVGDSACCLADKLDGDVLDL